MRDLSEKQVFDYKDSKMTISYVRFNTGKMQKLLVACNLFTVASYPTETQKNSTNLSIGSPLIAVLNQTAYKADTVGLQSMSFAIDTSCDTDIFKTSMT